MPSRARTAVSWIERHTSASTACWSGWAAESLLPRQDRVLAARAHQVDLREIERAGVGHDGCARVHPVQPFQHLEERRAARLPEPPVEQEAADRRPSGASRRARVDVGLQAIQVGERGHFGAQCARVLRAT
jgi:hypothetical protein